MTKKKVKKNLNQNKDNYCWIHMKNLRTFLHLGINPFEQTIGQNINIDLSLKINFTNTQDQLSHTTDYGAVWHFLQERIQALGNVKLLEYLAEQLLLDIGKQFKKVLSVKITIEKDYVPLKNFTGHVKIEARQDFNFQ
jgi:dihydroneopterin aldolase